MNFFKKVFILHKFVTDLKTPTLRYPIAENLTYPQLGKYYFVFQEKRVSSRKDQRLISKFDEIAELLKV